MGVLDIFRSKQVAAEPVNLDKQVAMRANLVKQIKALQLYRTAKQIKDWREALIMAENIDFPTRYYLIALYNEIANDDQVITQTNKAYKRLMSTGFEIVDKNGNIDEEKTALFDAEWFDLVVRLILESDYYGFSLIQMGSIKDDKYIVKEIQLVPREYVIPEKELVQLFFGDPKGISFLDPYFANNLLPVGQYRNLGLFNAIAPLFIYKKNAMSFWADYQQKFGEPIMLAQTDLANDKNVVKITEFLENFGNNAYLIAALEDKLQLIESGNQDAYKVYLELINHVDKAISKVLDGNTMTTDAEGGQYKGDVHSETSEYFHHARLTMVRRVVNDLLIPKMIKDGFPLEGYKFKFKEHKDIDGVVDRVVKLTGAGYSIPKEYVQSITGIEMQDAPKQQLSNSIMNDISEIYGTIGKECC